jgi:surface antigen
MTDWNRDGFSDLVEIKKSSTGSRSTEVHVLSGATNFRQFILQTGTALGEVGSDFEFEMTDWNRDGRSDLVAIKKSSTGSRSTEVHVLSGATNFRQFILQTGTALGEVGSNFTFLMPDTPTNQPPSPSGYLGSSTIEIPVNWNLAAYRQNNIFWNSGNAPSSTGSPNNQLNGATGNCTWYVNGRLQQLGYSKYALDSMPGWAGTWDDTASRGVTKSSVPQVGAIAQWESGHVAVVERVNADGSILISESSYYQNVSNKTGSYLYNTLTIVASAPTRYLIVPRA